VVPPGTRAVVVAPHPDDETLAAGGLIQRILRAGGTVRVVVLTAGDGYLEAAAALTGHDPPSRADYRALGVARASEIREAMATLGVRDLVLLDGPDDGLAALSTSDAPYTSPHTGRGPFTRTALVDALRASIAAVSPTLIVGPDPRDHHPDHAAGGRFTDAAVGLSPRPTVLTYLVHDTVWPPPSKTGPAMPVPGSEYAATPWVSVRLDAAELETKREALAAYRTQWPIIGGLLDRFLRGNEVFAVWDGP